MNIKTLKNLCLKVQNVKIKLIEPKTNKYITVIRHKLSRNKYITGFQYNFVVMNKSIRQICKS